MSTQIIRQTVNRIQIIGHWSPHRALRAAFWGTALLFGFLQGWNNRNMITSDGISYLDLSDAYLRGGWKMLLNGHWSPMYPWLLAIARAVLRPTAYWEFAFVDLVNFLIFLLAALAFEVFLRELLITNLATDDTEPAESMPSWAMRGIAYLTFLWLSLTLISVDLKSPDMLTSVFAYLAFAFVLRIRRAPAGWVPFVFLGTALGFGYLAKTPMFPLAFVFLGTTLFCAGRFSRAVPRVLLALLVFLLISAPLVIGLSRVKGRLTFGDSGRLNYLSGINKTGPSWYMQNLGSAGGKFVHPPQRIFDSPPVYSFVGPVGGTQPVWYDPSYWIEGVKPRFDLHGQRARLWIDAGAYFDLVFVHEAALLAAFVVLCWLGPQGRWARFLRTWPLWLTAVAALGMYLIVLVQGRYVAMFLIVLWLTLFSGIRLRIGSDSRVAAGTALALLLALGTPLLRSATEDLYSGAVYRHQHPQWQLAQDLQRMSVQPGDLVGRIGGPQPVEWARLLRVRVIAEIPRRQAEDFWSSTPAVQAQVIASFKNVGATAIIAEQLPPFEGFVPPPGWLEVGRSNYYVYLIRNAAP